MDILAHTGSGGLGIVLATDWSSASCRRSRRRGTMRKLSARVPVLALFLIMGALQAAPQAVSFLQSAQSIDAYDFVEVSVQVTQPDVKNPFTDVSVRGTFGKRGSQRLSVEGFCDSADGTIFRVRFMPTTSGEYTYSIVYKQGEF